MLRMNFDEHEMLNFVKFFKIGIDNWFEITTIYQKNKGTLGEINGGDKWQIKDYIIK